MLNAGVAAQSGGKATATQLSNGGVLNPGVQNFLGTQSTPADKPKAVLNWILFDEQFNYVSCGSGADPVGASEEFKIHLKTGLAVTKNGYLYLYVSFKSRA